MQWVESYLSQVRRYLPGKSNEDIIAELRASIEEQVHDVAGDAAAQPADEKTVLNRFGHPLKVASGYRGQRYLIGPELYPTFIQTLKTVLLLVAFVRIVIIFTAYAASGGTVSIMGVFGNLFETLLLASAIVLLSFAAIEVSGDQLHWYESWDADSLKPGRGAGVDSSDLITNLVTEAVFLLWWNDILPFQNWIPRVDGEFVVTLTEVWSTVYWPFNLIVGGWFLLHAWVLLRGVWYTNALRLEIALGAAAIGIMAWLIAHRPLLNIMGDTGNNAAVIGDRVLLSVLVFVIAFTAWDVFKAYRRLRTTAAQR